MTADSEQETTSWTAGIVASDHLADGSHPRLVYFQSKEVEKTFSTVLNSRRATRGRLVITDVKSDDGKVLLTIDDDHTSLVVGNFSRIKETAYPDQNISVQLPIIREDAEVDDTTLKAENVPDGIKTQVEPKIDHSHFPIDTMTLSPQSLRKQSPSSKPQHHSTGISTGTQGEMSDQFNYSSSPENYAMNPTSSMSYMSNLSHAQTKRSSNITTATTGAICDDQSPLFTSQDGVGKGALVIESSPEKFHNEFAKKKHHTIHCALHGVEYSVGVFYNTLEECNRFYDKEFASGFEQFLSKGKDGLSSSINEKSSNDYLQYIEYHLQNKKCPSFCSRLWRFCTINVVCSVFQYADEGLLIFSKHREGNIGTIFNEYTGLKEKSKQLGKGGFGNVYKYNQPGTEQRLAIKVEEKRSLAGCNPKLFQKIANLDHPNVIKMMEYLTGPVIKDGKRLCQFVMPLMNRKDLSRQFRACHCILDYMEHHPNIRNYIFRNYLVLFCQVFEGLRYLKTQRIVHRDIKPSNILVHQKCKCKNTILCQCPEATALYVVSDLDLVCFEGANCGMKFEEWKMAQHDPAGTTDMKPLEAFYYSGKGELVINHRSDIWSGSVTMMNILVGKSAKWEPHDQIKKFLSFHTDKIRTASNGIATSCNILDDLIKKCNTLVSPEIKPFDGIYADIKTLKKLLKESNESLRKVQSFQGEVPEIYKEESPLAGILSTVYIANSLHYVCLSKLPDIHNTTLWNCMKKTLDHIAEGIKFFPDNRQDAGKFVELLKPLQVQVME